MGSGAFVEYAAVAASAGVMAITITLVVHIAKYGEEKGALRERIKRLEQEMIEQKDMKATVIKLGATVEVLTTTIDDLRGFLQSVMRVSQK